ncbi:hypothetical protein [Methanomassiliicoccus luminyensis]|uniref:hypothetical protein n=1 Tax=Methanomassiliicoccus luminyensis TaxID=1080712 RepID=UPI000380ED62|nr:hypothetical protein [Methanomassiliicoccus luminyensis]
MNEENSKEMADAGSFGMKFRFHAHGSMDVDRFIGLVEGTLTEVGKRVVGKRRALIGHVKAFITTEHGTLKVNLIDMKLGPETVNRITSPTVHEGEMKFMAALVGISDHDLEEIMEASLEELGKSLHLEIEEHDHEHVHELHEHGCDHDHEHEH